MLADGDRRAVHQVGIVVEKGLLPDPAIVAVVRVKRGQDGDTFALMGQKLIQQLFLPLGVFGARLVKRKA